MRFDLRRGYEDLCKTVTGNYNIDVEFPRRVAYVTLNDCRIFIDSTKDLMECKEYTDRHYRTGYLRLVVHHLDLDEKRFVGLFKLIKSFSEYQLEVAERSRTLLQQTYNVPQCAKGQPMKPQRSFQIVTITQGIVSTHIIYYEFKDGFDGLRKAVSNKFKDTEGYLLAYFDSYSSLTLIQNSIDFNEGYSCMEDSSGIVLYYFPKIDFREAYKHHFREGNRRLSENTKGNGKRLFKLESWFGFDSHSLVPYYISLQYNPDSGISGFKDMVEKEDPNMRKYALGFDVDMDLICIETNEDLVECGRAISGPITVFGVFSGLGVRKVNRLWYDQRNAWLKRESS